MNHIMCLNIFGRYSEEVKNKYLLCSLTKLQDQVRCQCQGQIGQVKGIKPKVVVEKKQRIHSITSSVRRSVQVLGPD